MQEIAKKMPSLQQVRTSFIHHFNFFRNVLDLQRRNVLSFYVLQKLPLFPISPSKLSDNSQATLHFAMLFTNTDAYMVVGVAVYTIDRIYPIGIKFFL